MRSLWISRCLIWTVMKLQKRSAGVKSAGTYHTDHCNDCQCFLRWCAEQSCSRYECPCVKAYLDQMRMNRKIAPGKPPSHNMLVRTCGVAFLKTFPKPLSHGEEKLYLKRCKEGDQTARNMLIEHNMRLVAHVVKNINVRTMIQKISFLREPSDWSRQ